MDDFEEENTEKESFYLAFAPNKLKKLQIVLKWN